MKIDMLNGQRLQIASMNGHSYSGASSSLLSPNAKQLELIQKESSHFCSLITPYKLPNQLLIKSIGKPKPLLYYVLESFSSCIFFTPDKSIAIILMTLPPKGCSRTRSMPKGDKDDCKCGSASGHAKAKQASFLQLRMTCVCGERRFIKS